MNKLQHLKTTKAFLRKVLQYRRNLVRLNAGKILSPGMVKTMAEMDYYLGTITSFDRMMGYISQRGVRIRIFDIIPSNKKGWMEEYDRLVFTGQVLEGRISKQPELNY